MFFLPVTYNLISHQHHLFPSTVMYARGSTGVVHKISLVTLHCSGLLTFEAFSNMLLVSLPFVFRTTFQPGFDMCMASFTSSYAVRFLDVFVSVEKPPL